MGSAVLAYLITFTTYGSRLHGDRRGSVSRTANQFDTPVEAPDPKREAREAGSLRNPPPLLDEARRTTVRATIEEVCRHRQWTLWTTNVRTNHVHIVVTATQPADLVMRSMKSWATRRLVLEGLVARGERLWTRHGSTRYMWSEQDVDAACRYVREGQGFELPGSVTPESESTQNESEPRP